MYSELAISGVPAKDTAASSRDLAFQSNEGTSFTAVLDINSITISAGLWAELLSWSPS